MSASNTEFQRTFALEQFYRLVNLAAETRQAIIKNGFGDALNEEIPVVGWTEEDLLLLNNKQAVKLAMAERQIESLQEEVYNWACQQHASTGQPMTREEYMRARGWPT